MGWYVRDIAPKGLSFAELGVQAARLKPGQSGLLALDWMNGNRSIFHNASLTGLIMGLTLQTKPEEIYRALIESTAFGARMIMDQFVTYGYPVDPLIVCGGIPRKNPLLVDIFSNVLKREVSIAKSSQTCALGAAIAAGVIGEVWPSFPVAISHMSGVEEQKFVPRQSEGEAYDRLYAYYEMLSYAFAQERQASLCGLLSGLKKIQVKAQASL